MNSPPGAITRFPPFTGDNPHEIFQKILKCKITFVKKTSVHLRDLISKLLCVNVKDRLGSADVH